MSHAFAAESMAHCEAKGHRWRQVRAWHDVVWHECYCCGETRASSGDPGSTFGDPRGTFGEARGSWGETADCEPATPECVAPPSPEPTFYEPGARVDNCVANGPISVGELVATVNGMVESIKPKKRRPPRAPVGTRPHGGQNRKAERDRQVLALLAAGRPGKEIADHFGLTESRISQIKKAAAAAQGAV